MGRCTENCRITTAARAATRVWQIPPTPCAATEHLSRLCLSTGAAEDTTSAFEQVRPRPSPRPFTPSLTKPAPGLPDAPPSVPPLKPDCPCRCRRDLLPGPVPLAGVGGAGRQLLRRRPVLRQGRPALLRREPPRRLRGPVLRGPYCGRQAGVLRRLRGGGGAHTRCR